MSNPVDLSATDPYRVFALSDSVLSGINNVDYSFSFRGTGFLSNIIPAVLGRTHLGTSTELDHPLMELRFEETQNGSAKGNFTVPSTYIATEDSLYFIDNEAGIVYRGNSSSGAQGIFNFPAASLMMEYVVPHPFSDELNADSIAVLFPGESGGVSCYVFHVFYHDQEGSETIWYIGMEDFLPRAVERIGYYGETGDPGGQLLEISNIGFPSEMPGDPSVPSGSRLILWNSPLTTGDSAPAFFLANRDGYTVRPTDFPGMFLLLCFFSSNDSSSLSALGSMNSLAEEFGDYVQILGISILETTDIAFRLESLEIKFPILVFGESAAEDFLVRRVPSVFLLSPERHVLFSSSGFSGDAETNIRQILENSI